VSDTGFLAILPLRNAAAAVDASLDSFDRYLPGAVEVWLLADEGLDPRVETLVGNWLETTRLRANMRRAAGIAGPLRACQAAMSATEHDVLLLQPGARLAGDAARYLREAMQGDACAATLSPWSNDAEVLSYPRFGEANPLPTNADELAEAAAGLPACVDVALPAAVGGGIAFRIDAWRRLGGFDIDTYSTLMAAIGDYSRRAAAMGWRNAFCPRVFLPYAAAEPLSATGEDLQRLFARWPDHYERTARFMLDDPMRAWRERLTQSLADLDAQGPQRDLFGMPLP
jgi:hypothetical protein